MEYDIYEGQMRMLVRVGLQFMHKPSFDRLGIIVAIGDLMRENPEHHVRYREENAYEFIQN